MQIRRVFEKNSHVGGSIMCTEDKDFFKTYKKLCSSHLMYLYMFV